MKYFLIFFLMTSFSSCEAQTKKPIVKNKKEFQWPKPLKDSSWDETNCDTLYGTVEMKVMDGVVSGAGFVTSCMTYQCSMNVYSQKDKATIDSVRRGCNCLFFDGQNCFRSSDRFRIAYFITSRGPKRIDGPFTFKPQ